MLSRCTGNTMQVLYRYFTVCRACTGADSLEQTLSTGTCLYGLLLGALQYLLVGVPWHTWLQGETAPFAPGCAWVYLRTKLTGGCTRDTVPGHTWFPRRDSALCTWMRRAGMEAHPLGEAPARWAPAQTPLPHAPPSASAADADPAPGALPAPAPAPGCCPCLCPSLHCSLCSSHPRPRPCPCAYCRSSPFPYFCPCPCPCPCPCAYFTPWPLRPRCPLPLSSLPPFHSPGPFASPPRALCPSPFRGHPGLSQVPGEEVPTREEDVGGRPEEASGGGCCCRREGRAR